jgi:hypothetical protein
LDFVSLHLVFGWFHSWHTAPGCSDFGSVGLGAGRLDVFFMAAFCPQFSSTVFVLDLLLQLFSLASGLPRLLTCACVRRSQILVRCWHGLSSGLVQTPFPFACSRPEASIPECVTAVRAGVDFPGSSSVWRSARDRSVRAGHSARFPRLVFPASQRPPVCFILRGRARCQASCFSLSVGLQQERRPVLLVAPVTIVAVWFCS